MTVIVCNNTSDAIRGMLKRWFIEPKPNVFVGTVNKKVREKTIEYIRKNSDEIGMLVIATDNSSQGFSIKYFGEPNRISKKISGHYLIAEKWSDSDINTAENTTGLSVDKFVVSYNI